MILNNYWAWKYAIEKNLYYVYNENYGTRQTTIKDTSGDARTIACNMYNTSYLMENLRMAGTLTHSVSDSSGEISVEDYALSDEISNVSVVSTGLTYNNTNNTMKYVFSCNGTNNNSSEITIRKVGLKKQLATYSPNRSTQYYYFLFAVVDLEEPITVPAGQGYTIVVDMTEQ